MSYFSRHKNIILLFFFFILLPVVLILLWRGLTLISITDLWNKPENRMNVLINLTAALAYGLIASFVIFFRHAIQSVVSPARTEEERQRTKQEQSYLDNLIDRFQQELPWAVDNYAELEAIFQEARRVEFRLRQVPNVSGPYVQENPGSRVDLLSFLRHEKGPIMIKGDPGTGKTLTLRRFGVDQAKVLKRTPGKGQLPVYISLAAYTGKTTAGKSEPLFDFLQHYLQEEFPDEVFLREHLTEYLKQGRLLLLFDGLNELPPDEYWDRYTELVNFISKRTTNKVIITCRTLRYTHSDKFSTVAISDLDNNQIKRFIKLYTDRFGPNYAENLYRELAADGFMLRVCRNPFMLHMLVNRDPKRPFPQSSAQLFEEFVEDSLGEVVPKTTDIIDTLRKIAFTMQVQGKFAGTVSLQWLKTECPHIHAAEQHIEVANRTKLIDYAAEKIDHVTEKKEPGEKKFRFYHQILQEYFAAKELQQEWEANRNLDKYFADYRWEDTILVCAGIAQNPEQFIRQIWSPGQNQLAAFWLAAKAVGISGIRVSDPYYHAILQEAVRNLDMNDSRDGFSPTELAVDTIKALAYIDDNNTTDILRATLIDHKGWIRELCVQTLGNSRDSNAREALRSATVKLRSIPILRMVAPYFTRQELLAMAAVSAMSFSLLSDTFWSMMQYLWILAPGFYIGAIYLSSRFFNIEPIALVGRAISLTFLVRFISDNARYVAKAIRLKVGWSVFLESLKATATGQAISIVLILIFWFFSGEVNALLIIGFALLWCLGVLGLTAALLRNIFSPLRMAFLLYSRIARLITFANCIIAIGWLIAFLIPFAWKVPSIKVLPHIASPVETMLWQADSFLLKSVVYASYLGYALTFLSILVHLLTWIRYWRLRRDQREFTKKGDQQAISHMVKVALDPSTWLHVRVRAFKELRLVDVPFQHVKELDRLTETDSLNDSTNSNWLLMVFGDGLDLKGELERTTYELLARAREEMREAPEENYIQILFNRASSRFQANNYRDSLTYLNQILSSNEKYLPALLLRGQVYAIQRRFDDGLDDLNKVIANDNQSILAFAYRGYIYCRNEPPHYPEAAADFSQSITLGNKEAWVFAYRGDVYMSMLRFPEALTDFDEAIALDNEVDWYFRYRGIVQYYLEHYAEAMSDFDQALAFDDQDADTLAWRGQTQLYLQHYSEAQADLTQAIALNKTSDFYYYYRALLYYVSNDTEAFKRDLTAAIDLAVQTLASETDHVEQWLLRFNLAHYNLVAGNTIDSQQQYDQLLTECNSLEVLTSALLALMDLLKIQPQNTLVQDLLARLKVCFHTLLQANPVSPGSSITR